MGRELKSVRLSQKEIEKVEQLVQNGEAGDFSSGVRRLINGKTRLRELTQTLISGFGIAGFVLLGASFTSIVQLHPHVFTPFVISFVLYGIDRNILRRHEPAISEWMVRRVPEPVQDRVLVGGGGD